MAKTIVGGSSFLSNSKWEIEEPFIEAFFNIILFSDGFINLTFDKKRLKFESIYVIFPSRVY